MHRLGIRNLFSILLCFLIAENGYAQSNTHAAYQRDFIKATPGGRFHYYKLLTINNNQIDLTLIKVQGKIGNPLKSVFIIDTCYNWKGEINNAGSGHLITDSTGGRHFTVKKRSASGLVLDFDGSIEKYKSISENVHIMLYKEKYCACKASKAFND